MNKNYRRREQNLEQIVQTNESPNYGHAPNEKFAYKLLSLRKTAVQSEKYSNITTKFHQTQEKTTSTFAKTLIKTQNVRWRDVVQGKQSVPGSILRNSFET
jgi:catalase (peroxidase I)